MGVRSPGVVCIIGDTAPYIFFLQNGLHIFTMTLTRAYFGGRAYIAAIPEKDARSDFQGRAYFQLETGYLMTLSDCDFTGADAF